MSGELVPRDSIGIADRQFRQRLAYWDEFFKVADEDQVNPLVNPAINELDGLWAQRGLLGMDCLINGEGMWTVTVPEEELTEEDKDNIQVQLPQQGTYTVSRFGRVVNVRCFSQGLSFLKFPDEERNSLAHQFLSKESFEGRGMLLNFNINHHIQIKLGTLSLLTVQDVELQLSPLIGRFEPQAALN